MRAALILRAVLGSVGLFSFDGRRLDFGEAPLQGGGGLFIGKRGSAAPNCDDVTDQCSRPELGAQITLRSDTSGALAAIAAVAVQRVPGTHYASVTRKHHDSFKTVASTEDPAYVADQLQYTLGSGPCVDAVTTDTVHHVSDLSHDRRWPQYGPMAVQAAGAHSMLSIPLRLEEDDTVAGLNLYSRDTDAFGQTSLTTGLLLATHGAVAVSWVRAREKSGHLETALLNSRVIGMAIGVLMATHKVTHQQAFDLLRIVSQNTNRKLSDVARDVAETGALEMPPHSAT